MRQTRSRVLCLCILMALLGASADAFGAWTMDMERLPTNGHLYQNVFHKVPSLSRVQPSTVVDTAQASVGMPWTSSIDPQYHKQDDLTFMPFWEWQLQYMQQHLTNLRQVPVTNLDGTQDLTYQENTLKQARIVNLCFTSDEYRKIRLTYYDAGSKAQVFNSLWYPHGNLPLLGIDLLQFHHQTKHLAVVDFQPIHSKEDQHDLTYHHLIQPISQQYPSLQGKMSSRFYDETQFFSPHMLFARFENDPQRIHKDLMPAFQEYVHTHVKHLTQQQPKQQQQQSTTTTTTTIDLQQRHAEYDVYSAKRDPATAMLGSMFGQEWADAFVHEFLFSQSRNTA